MFLRGVDETNCYINSERGGRLGQDMREKFGSIINSLIGKNRRGKPLAGIDIAGQFVPDETTPDAVFKNLNAAFLISLCGESHPSYSKAERFMDDLQKDLTWRDAVEFFRQGQSLIVAELEERFLEDKAFQESVNLLYESVSNVRNIINRDEFIERFWDVFFPEGVGLLKHSEETIGSLRRKRSVRIRRLNPSPIQDAAREILFTSNVLLTIPSTSISIQDLGLPEPLRGRLDEIKRERQVYWYDHPVQIGVETKKNEVIYGLKGLDQAIRFEKRRGIVAEEARVNCLISVSVTHEGLQDVAKEYLKEVFKTTRGFQHLTVYALTESDTSRLLDEILLPAAEYYLGEKNTDLLHDVIGVDGEYGRHYSLLKAIAPLWRLFCDSGVRAVFKIDLDQVFPQEELVKETGFSAFEHLKTPLWGAEGEDNHGGRVDLGMIAGALVNHKDIDNSLFTPDVSFPEGSIKGDEWIFFSRLPQAISTQAEMTTRYRGDPFDGRDSCIQRFHVTGGTCGILVDKLRKYRPFTPSFIGRAEDQAYLLSVLFKEPNGNLRYVHKDGLIMRHDKESFVGEAIRFAHIGKLIGDYARVLLFSYYAKWLPWTIEKTKQCVDPFTGCFISHIPISVVFLRFALKGASLFNEGKQKEGFDLLQMGTIRLQKIVKELVRTPNLLEDRFREEKRAWNIYYDTLDRAEEGLKRKDPFAIDMKKRTRRFMMGCKITSDE